MKQPGALHSVLQRIAGQPRALFQQGVHPASGEIPVKRRQRVGQQLAGVAARPDRRLVLQRRVGVVRAAGNRPGLGQPKARAVP
jgi:hypothetical protein